MLKMRYRALVEYDGTGYFGFQRQKDKPTVQEQLEQSISVITGEEINIIFAGRTDTGVHAAGQVIALDTAWVHGETALARATNARLPVDISIRDVQKVDDDFHPRFDATRRHYCYYIYNCAVRSPSKRLYSWHVKQELRLEEMNLAAKSIIGIHDFATFGKAPKGNNTIREVYSAEWRRCGELICFDIKANAFLYRMVRSVVGAMKNVGEGNWSIERFLETAASLERGRAGQSAPAHGLYLMSVTY